MNSLIPCLGLLLLVFGGTEALSSPFMTSQSSDSNRETLMSFLRGKLPLSPITGGLNVARDLDDDGADPTETSGNTGWVCQSNHCIKCFVIGGPRYCIAMVAYKAIGFSALAFADTTPFLESSITSNGNNAVATGIIPGCWFLMNVVHINVKRRSAAGSYAELRCNHFNHKVALGSFKIPLKSQSEEGAYLRCVGGSTHTCEYSDIRTCGDFIHL